MSTKDPSEPTPESVQERALITLTLGLTEKQVKLAVPITDEDLILLYQNQLASTRRSQVMRAIAGDKGTYQRWIDLVQTNELTNALTKDTDKIARAPSHEKYASDSTRENGSISKTKKRRHLDALLSWNQKNRGWKHIFGMGCIAALIAAFAVLLVPQMIQNPTLDELYDQYADAGSALLPEKFISTASDEKSASYSIAQTEVAKGILSGFEDLTTIYLPSEWEIDPTRFADNDTNPIRSAESPYALGRLVALSLIQCKLTKKNSYFEAAVPLMRKLTKSNISFVQPVLSCSSDRCEVCDTSEAIIKMM